uniref:MHD1 domain-containing protein n=1 Tax=Ditylenchus dipsaci TaxID=166011 RepID=A0A915D8B3_9BILA
MISTLVFKVGELRKRVASKFHKDKSTSLQCDSQDCPSIYHSANGTQRFLESIADVPEPSLSQVFEQHVELTEDSDHQRISYSSHAAEICRLVDIELSLATLPASKYSKQETKTLILDELEAKNLTDMHFKSDKPLLSHIIDQLMYSNKVDSLLPHFYNLNGTEKSVEEMVNAEIPMLDGDEFSEHSTKIARAFCRAMVKWRKSKTLCKIADLWCDAEQKEMGDQRQVLNKFDEVCDAIYALLISNLKSLMNEAGFRHQQFVNSLNDDQVEQSTQWLTKFISFLLCVKPLNQTITTQQFWIETELRSSLHRFEQWLGQEMLHRNYVKDQARSLHLALHLDSKDQQRLTDERLKQLSLGQTAKCLADMKKGLITRLFC